MTKKFRFPLNLQLFADGLVDFSDEENHDPNIVIEDDDDNDAMVELDGDDVEAPGETGISKPKVHAFDEEDETPPPAEEKQEEKQEDKTEDKPRQSAEDNARFAEQRRQREAQELLEKSPEYQLVQRLAKMNGVSVEEMTKRIEQAEIEAEAKASNRTVEQVQEARAEKERVANLEEQLVKLQYMQWESRVNGEQAQLKEKHPYLSDEDFAAAKEYMLVTVKNPNMTLSQAIHAVHGETIAEKMKESVRNEVLAEMSGRSKNSSLPPQGGRPNSMDGLTAEEKAVAKSLGLPESVYLKYKQTAN